MASVDFVEYNSYSMYIYLNLSQEHFKLLPSIKLNSIVEMLTLNINYMHLIKLGKCEL